MDCLYQDIEGYRFEGWGGHTGRPFNAYLTAAAAIGKYFYQLFNNLVILLQQQLLVNIFINYLITWGGGLCLLGCSTEQDYLKMTEYHV